MDYPELSGATISERDKLLPKSSPTLLMAVCAHLTRLAGN